MNKLKDSSNNTTHIILYLSAILLSASLLAVSFPPFNLWPAAYFFLVPILIFICKYNTNNWRSFAISFLSGLIGYGVVLYWIFPTVFKYTGSFLQSAVSLFLISAYPSLYLGVWGFIAGIYLQNEREKEKKSSTVFSVLLLAMVWVGLEYIRSLLFTGFPWAIIGYSQWNFHPALWSAAYGGVFAVSFVVVVGNFIFIRGIKTAADKILLLCFSFYLIFGAMVSSGKKESHSKEVVNVTVIQPSVDQIEKWDERYFEKTKEKISLLVREAVSDNNKDRQNTILVWPETSLTEIISSRIKILPPWLESVVKNSASYHIIGSLYGEFNGPVYNSAILVTPEGELRCIHRKTHLVPFGEFVPFRKYLEPFFGVFNEIGDLEKGDKYTVMELDNNEKNFSTVICSENLFGGITRKFVKNGAGFLAVITNDAWYDRTPAAFQHFTFNVLRAVENSRWIVQSANTGISGVISDDGRVVHTTGLFEVTHFNYDVPLKSNLTFYTRYGDLFAIMCLVISVGSLVVRLFFLKYLKG